MDFSKLKGKSFYKNKFCNNKELKVSILNHSLHFASSVFEGIRVYNARPFLLGDHFQRLINSSKIMQLDFKIPYKKFKLITYKLIKINKLKDGYIRPIVFRSSNSMSPDTSECKTLFAMSCWKWPTLFNQKKGISLITSKWPKLNSDIYPIQAKSSGSYQCSVIDKVRSRKLGYDDSLILDLNKNVAETTACNIFWIKNKIVYTPSTKSILNGVTRKAVIKICKQLKIKVIVGDYSLKNIMNSDTIFLSGTAAELQQINKINKKKFKLENQIFNRIKENFEILKNRSPDYL